MGSTWVRDDAVHYHTTAIHVRDNWRGLSSQAYVSMDAWGLPLRPWGPCFGNLRAWTSNR